MIVFLSLLFYVKYDIILQNLHNKYIESEL